MISVQALRHVGQNFLDVVERIESDATVNISCGLENHVLILNCV